MNESGAGVAAPPLVALEPTQPPSPASSPHSPSLLLPCDAFDGCPLLPAADDSCTSTASAAGAAVTTAIGSISSSTAVSFTGGVTPALLHRGGAAVRESRVASPSPAPSPSSPRPLYPEDSVPCPYDHLRPEATSVSTHLSCPSDSCSTTQCYNSGLVHSQLSDSTHSLPYSSHPCDISSSPGSSSPSYSSHSQAHSYPLPATSLLDYHHHYHHHHHHSNLQKHKSRSSSPYHRHHHHLSDSPADVRKGHRQNQSPPRPAGSNSPRSSSPSSSPSSTSSSPSSSNSPPPSEPESPLTPPPTPPTAAGGLQGAGPSSPCQRTFREAVSNGNTAELRRILEEREGKVNVNLLDMEGQTALHHSCLQGNLELVKILVRFGADVKLANRDGWAPLHLAVYAGHSDVMLFLLALQQTQSHGGGACDRRT